MSGMRSQVYFTPCSLSDPLKRRASIIAGLYKAAGFSQVLPSEGLVAVKTHFGEGACAGFIKPEMIREVVSLVSAQGCDPFVTDTNTLYRRRRHNSVEHLALAREHGFTHSALGCPVLIADGLRGNNSEEIEIDGVHFKRAPIAGDIARADGMVVCSHLTGHMVSGWGATIKNLAMGCAPRRGKLMQHASMKPFIDAKVCIACGRCAEHCPEDAITIPDRAVIDESKCIGCGECITACPTFAVKFSWKTDSALMQEKMAEFALAAVKAVRGRAVYFNFLLYVTANCDCDDTAQKPVSPDIGIMASTDPVALDAASIALFSQKIGTELRELSHPRLYGLAQLAHAEKIGLGSTQYEIVEVRP